MSMSKQFRLGYKLGRLHGRLQYATETTTRWNEYVGKLNQANMEAAKQMESSHNVAVAALDEALTDSGMKLADLDEAQIEPADRKTRRKMKRQAKRWSKEQDQPSEDYHTHP